jgi:hypothetical protein
MHRSISVRGVYREQVVVNKSELSLVGQHNYGNKLPNARKKGAQIPTPKSLSVPPRTGRLLCASAASASALAANCKEVPGMAPELGNGVRFVAPAPGMAIADSCYWHNAPPQGGHGVPGLRSPKATPELR